MMILMIAVTRLMRRDAVSIDNLWVWRGMAICMRGEFKYASRKGSGEGNTKQTDNRRCHHSCHNSGILYIAT